ncbi:glycosyl transferase family 2 [Roseimicrobium gellanilyticum]|uniref:Glycosyl transferase family 2 n=1 Tax=Roseimicrobium gellanilyticum TaxID=748857 RepID=A0A366H7D0_9BACT|nr:glycosyltransferase [Roseimicrobium gellanilyticum]RBP37415.1 glycosyl transferase family 2 [Roseimicrobium gellanilyticum]
MAKCRVYLTTYRRNELLRRALSSLLEQTFQDWVCELHNDAPDDPFPGELVKELNDPRFIYRPHPQNYGPVKSFNLFFKPISEPFFSILEDDNWWEPRLLERLMALLETSPEASLAWANMRYWKEQDDGTWEKTDRTVWDREIYREPFVFKWADPKQVYQALHSIGSMVVRTSSFTTRPVPETLPFFAIDPARERLYPGPLILEPEVLANFALTRQTARKTTITEDTQASILLARSFLRHVNASDTYYAQVWKNAQGWPVRSSNTLVIASILAGKLKFLFRHATMIDWLFFAASWVKRPLRMFRLMRSVSAYPEVSRFLDERTAEICAVAASPPRAVT